MSKTQSAGVRPLLRSVALLGVLAGTGFSQGCSNEFDVAPVSGVVQREGAPFAGGRIVFMPLSKGKPAAGEIDEQGNFQLTTYEQGDGATVGRHRVHVVAKRGGEDEEERLNFTAPDDFFVEVKAGQDNEVRIQISREAGWMDVYED